jgi:SWI/SNF-related matrix-associated actin-dependent regulator 1 of chromatin subfamily A
MEAIPQTIEMVDNMLETDKKVIIFTSFTDELNELAEYFGKKCVTHNGPMNDKEKQKSVDQFQNNPNIRVFIGNIKSAGVGITLTEANFVVFNSFDWVPGQNEQAEDRAYRIGQKNNVNVYYQLFEDTISTRMWETLRNKKDIISTIMGDKQLSDEEIIEIMTDKLINEDYG